MFEFKLSEMLTQRVLAHLNGFGVTTDPAIDIESLRVAWGKHLVHALGECAQFARYGQEPPDEYCFIVGGRFPPDVDNDLGGMIPVPEGAAGDEIMLEISREFVDWVKVNGSTLTLSPRAPITKLEARGDDIVMHLRPPDPPVHDPTFVPSVVVE